MPNQFSTTAAAVAIAFAAWLHASEADRFCITHPLWWSCDNPSAQLPEYGHEQPEAPSAPLTFFIQTVAVANTSNTAA